MSNYFSFTSDDLLQLIGSLTLISPGIYYIIRLLVNHQFNKKLESHKANLTKLNDEYRAELNSEVEKLKHKQQRMFRDFDLYISKKHEKYPELFKLIEEAFGQTYSLRGATSSPNYSNVDKTDLRNYLSEHRFTNKDIDDVLALWDTERKNDAVILINNRIRWINYNTAREKWVEANDYHIFNELFLSEEVSAISRQLLESLHGYWLLLDPFNGNSKELRIEQEEYRNNTLPEIRKNLKSLMKKEMSISLNTTNLR